MSTFAYVLLKHTGAVERAHGSTGQYVGDGSILQTGDPSADPADLEKLLQSGYRAVRELVVPGLCPEPGVTLGAKVLLVLEKP